MEIYFRELPEDIRCSDMLTAEQTQHFLRFFRALDKNKQEECVAFLMQMLLVPIVGVLHDNKLLHQKSATIVEKLLRRAYAVVLGPELSAKIHQQIWNLAARHAVQRVWFNNTHRVTMSRLPLDGWIWLKNLAQQNPRTAFNLIDPDGLSTKFLGSTPPLANSNQKRDYAECILVLFQALETLIDASDPEQAALYFIHDGYTALLSGWEWTTTSILINRMLDQFLHIRDRPDFQQSHPFWCFSQSAHEHLTLHAELATLSLKDRLTAIAHITAPGKKIDSQSKQNYSYLSQNSTIKRLFYPR